MVLTILVSFVLTIREKFLVNSAFKLELVIFSSSALNCKLGSFAVFHFFLKFKSMFFSAMGKSFIVLSE